MSSTRRTFIGLALDETTRIRLHRMVSEVLDDRDWKLHEPEDLHLTLCFVGDTTNELVPLLASNLRVELARLQAPRLRLRGVGSFGPDRAPRVLWAGVAGADRELERLQVLRGAASRALDAASIAWDARPFSPHVTLARPRRESAPPYGFAALDFDFDWQPAAVELFETVAGGRPHYQRIESFALTA
jgi:2'-5' RNA ligase